MVWLMVNPLKRVVSKFTMIICLDSLSTAKAAGETLTGKVQGFHSTRCTPCSFWHSSFKSKEKSWIFKWIWKHLRMVTTQGSVWGSVRVSPGKWPPQPPFFGPKCGGLRGPILVCFRAPPLHTSKQQKFGTPRNLIRFSSNHALSFSLSKWSS